MARRVNGDVPPNIYTSITDVYTPIIRRQDTNSALLRVNNSDTVDDEDNKHRGEQRNVVSAKKRVGIQLHIDVFIAQGHRNNKRRRTPSVTPTS